MKRLLRCILASASLVSSSMAMAAAETALTIEQLALLTPLRGATRVDVPSDRELERSAARIGQIQIAIDDVFEDAAALARPYRIVNTLHVSTRVATVEQQLLFRPGDPYSRRLLDETARLLRGQRYLSEAAVEVVRYNADNTVDVLVHVHDVWTMNPGFSFGRKGGENSVEVEFEDTNFLGFGKTVSVERSKDVDRSAWRLAYIDPHLLGTWWRLSAVHSALSDGSHDEFSIGRPFYSLDSRWGTEFATLNSELDTPLYSLGKQIGSFGTKRESFDLGGGRSRGLVDGWATRYLFGVRYDAKSFAATEDSPAVLPEDRRYAYPYVGVQWLEDSYITTRNLNQIGRIEDLQLGRSLTVTAGLASSALGSSSNALVLASAGQAGLDLGQERYLVGFFNLESRIESVGPRNARLDVGGRYYRRQSEHRVFFAGAEATYTSHPDGDTQLLLGGDNGLRGYPLRYQAGTSRAVFTLEERFYTSWQPLKLVNVGAAIFADAGRMWGRDPYAAAPEGWFTNLGLGLRLGTVRSGFGNILHIDVAMPLNRTNDIDAVQLLIETKQSF